MGEVNRIGVLGPPVMKGAGGIVESIVRSAGDRRELLPALSIVTTRHWSVGALGEGGTNGSRVAE